MREVGSNPVRVASPRDGESLGSVIFTIANTRAAPVSGPVFVNTNLFDGHNWREQLGTSFDTNAMHHF